MFQIKLMHQYIKFQRDCKLLSTIVIKTLAYELQQFNAKEQFVEKIQNERKKKTAYSSIKYEMIYIRSALDFLQGPTVHKNNLFELKLLDDLTLNVLYVLYQYNYELSNEHCYQ